MWLCLRCDQRYTHGGRRMRQCPECRSRKIVWDPVEPYEPTKAEIADACAVIQQTWSEGEEQSRRCVKNPACEFGGRIWMARDVRRNGWEAI